LLLSEQPADDEAGAEPVRIGIGICTARRPLMLANCLDAVGAQIVRAGVEVHIIVVDNEAAPNNQGLVEDFAERCAFPVHYLHEPTRGIPQARNAALEKCVELGVAWIGFTDDDCWVSPVWLAGLLDATARHEADAVYGRRDFVFPLPLPYWAAHSEQTYHVEGQKLPHAATHNVLFSASLVRDGNLTGLRFDESLSHGEDTDFFYRAAQRGARIVFSRRPVVFEMVAPERATLNYQTWRAYHYAASRSYFHRRHDGTLRAFWGLLDRVVLKAPAAIARLGVAPLVWPFDERAFKSLVLKGAARLAGVAGATAGLLGRPGNPYG
jgi:succinoglycan biosynthesis protein ExoM